MKGLSNPSTGGNVTWLNLIANKGKDACYFRESEKTPTGWNEKARYTQMVGLIDGPIRFFEKDYQGEKSRYFSVKVVDDEGGAAICQFRFNSIGITVLNSLLNVEHPKIETLTFRCGFNKNGYPNVYISGSDGELVGFKLDFKEDLPPVESQEFKGKMLYDSTARQDFMQKKVEEKYGVFVAQGNASTVNSNSATTNGKVDEGEGDDAPW